MRPWRKNPTSSTSRGRARQGGGETLVQMAAENERIIWNYASETLCLRSIIL